jgi:hypothetical protein
MEVLRGLERQKTGRSTGNCNAQAAARTGMVHSIAVVYDSVQLAHAKVKVQPTTTQRRWSRHIRLPVGCYHDHQLCLPAYILLSLCRLALNRYSHGVNYYNSDHDYKYNSGDDYDNDSSAYGKSATKETEVIEILSESSNASSSYVGFIPSTRKKSIPQAISQHNRHSKTLHASVKTPSGM